MAPVAATSIMAIIKLCQVCSHARRDGPLLALVSCMTELDLQDRASLRPTDMCQRHPSVRILFPFPPIHRPSPQVSLFIDGNFQV